MIKKLYLIERPLNCANCEKEAYLEFTKISVILSIYECSLQ